jgi:hypothetical protein
VASKRAKKKKRRQSTQSAGIDPNERRRERLEAKRREREEEARRRRQVAQRRQVVRVTMLLLLGVGVVWFLFLRNVAPSEIDGHPVRTFDASTFSHTNDPVQYETTPPVAGQHAPTPAACGVHDTQIPDENYVHSLEHGAVAVLYDPAQVKAPDIKSIESIVSSFPDRTISAPYADMDTPIVVASWGEKMELDSLDQRAIRDYIAAFRGKGREDIPCPNTEDLPFEPQPTPSPSPSPTQG